MTCHDLPWQNKATLSKMEELAEAATFLGVFLMNIQAETGLVDQVDHVKTVTKANMIMFTFLLPAQQHVSVLVTLWCFLRKHARWRGLGILPTYQLQIRQRLASREGCTPFENGNAKQLKTAIVMAVGAHHLRKRTRVLGSDNYSVFVNGNNPAFMGTIFMLHWLSQIERSVPLYPTELNLYHSSPLIRVEISSKHRVLPRVFRCF